MNVLFMKGTHFVLDKLQNGASYVFSFLTEDSAQNYYQDPLFLRAFERVSVSVSMSAAVLGSNGCISSSYCFSATESATIIWKSHLLSFWISKSLTFKNINIDFSDMFPFSSDTFTFSNSYLTQKSQCCICDTQGNCQKTTGSDCFCGSQTQNLPKSFKSKRFAEFNNPGTPYFKWYRRAYGIFNMDFLSDYSSATKPILTIKVPINSLIIFFLYYFFKFSL